MSGLSEALHGDRTAAGTLRVDCWACEAAQSPTIQALVNDTRAAALAPFGALAAEWREAARMKTPGTGVEHVAAAFAAKGLLDIIASLRVEVGTSSEASA